MEIFSRLYAYIGMELAAKSPEHSHDYSDWIRTYSGPEALEQASKSEALLNLLAPGEDFGKNNRHVAVPFPSLSLLPVRCVQHHTLPRTKHLNVRQHEIHCIVGAQESWRNCIRKQWSWSLTSLKNTIRANLQARNYVELQLVQRLPRVSPRGPA